MKKKILQAVNNYGNYSIGGKSFVYNQLIKNVSIEIPIRTYTFGSYQNNTELKQNHKYLIYIDNEELVGRLRVVGTSYASPNGTKIIVTFTYETGSSSSYMIQLSGTSTRKSHLVLSDLTDLEQSLGITINTLEDFYATEYGQAVKNGFIPPYAPTNTKYDSHTPFRFIRDNGKEKVFSPETPIVLRSAGSVKDTWRNCSGKVYRAETDTTELAQSMALPKGIAHVYDANNVELTIERRN